MELRGIGIDKMELRGIGIDQMELTYTDIDPTTVVCNFEQGVIKALQVVLGPAIVIHLPSYSGYLAQDPGTRPCTMVLHR